MRRREDSGGGTNRLKALGWRGVSDKKPVSDPLTPTKTATITKQEQTGNNKCR